ncbi:hypothetical protein Tco_0163849 [Tanacetum coccineum]
MKLSAKSNSSLWLYNVELVSVRLAVLCFSSPFASNGLLLFFSTSGSGLPPLRLRRVGGRIVGRIVVEKQWLGLVVVIVVEKIGYIAIAFSIGLIAFVHPDWQNGLGSWDSKAFC